jgi:RHS repeat-associated protein
MFRAETRRRIAGLIAIIALVLTGAVTSAPAAIAASALMPFVVTNNSGLSDDTFVYVMARDQGSGEQGYVDGSGTWHKFALPTVLEDGQHPPAAPDTAIAGPANGASISIPLRSGLVAGRAYISFGDELQFFLTPDGLVEPAGWVETDPNHDVIYDWVEFARDGTQLFINTTMVDMFSVPISVSATNGDGSRETQGRLVNNGRSRIFNALKSYGLGGLIQYRDGGSLPIRALAPIHGMEAGVIPSNYFADYVNDAWSYYSTTDLTVETAAGLFTGRVVANKFVFKNAGGNVVGTFSKFSTSDIFACEGTTQPTGQPDRNNALAIGARLCAAFNRGTLSTANHAGSNVQATYDATAFYPPGIESNLYSKAMHLNEANGNAYGFAFDDVAEFSPAINSPSPKTAGMTVAPFVGSSSTGGKEVKASVESLFGHSADGGYSDDPVNVATGNYTQEETLVDFADDWSPRIAMTYNSMDDRPGPFGIGWSSLLSESVTEQTNGDALVSWPDGSTTLYANDNDDFTAPPGTTARLDHTNTGWTVTRQDASTENFDNAGRISTFADGAGRIVTVTRNGAGKATGLTGAAGRTITLTWTGDTITGITTSDARTASLTYDTAGHLTSTTDAAGAVRAFAYDAHGFLSQVTDADDATTVTNRYDDDGRVLEQARPGLPTEVFTYDLENGVTDILHADGTQQMRYEFDEQGRLVTTTAADGTTSTQEFDENGYPTRLVDRSGAVTEKTFTPTGLLSSVTANAATTQFTYDALGRTLTVTDPAGKVTAYVYANDSRIPTSATLPDGSDVEFDATGAQLESKTDADGNTTEYTYDTHGNVATSTTATGATTAFTYDGSGNLHTRTAPTGGVTTYTYDASGRQTSVTDAVGAVTTTTYTAAGRISSTTDADGRTTSYTYDADGRMATSVAPGGGVTTYVYNADGDLTGVTDATGTATALTYDRFGRVETSTVGGKTTTFVYDANGRQTSSSAGVQSSKLTYDDSGRVLTSSDANGDMARYVYDALGRQIKSIGADGTFTTATYDSVGNLTGTVDELGRTSSATYSATGLRTSAKDPMGYTTKYGYDDDGRLTTVTTPGDHVWTYDYDDDGHQTSVTSPTGLVTRDGYDAAGRITSSTRPGVGATTTEYTPSGNVSSVTDSSGHTITYAYDNAGRLATSTDAAGGETTYAYNVADQLVSTTDPRGGKTTYAYDASGQLSAETDPLDRTTSYEYDASGNLTKTTDPDGDTTAYSYDWAGQLIGRVDPSGNATSWTYNVRGQRLSMTDHTGSTKYTYDAAGQLTKIDGPDDATFMFTYDGNGRPATINYPDGTVVSYGRDADGNLAAVSDNHGHSLSYTVNADGQITREGSSAGMVRTFSFLDGQLRQYTEQMTTQSPTISTEVTRDAEGRIASTLTGGVTTAYGYDAAGQLTSVDAPGTGSDAAYSYDAAGNRATSAVGAKSETYSYDAANQLTTINRGGQTYATLDYDGAGRLTGQSAADGAAISLQYDGSSAPTRIERDSSAGHAVAELSRDGDGYPVSVDTSLQAPGSTTVSETTAALEWLTLEGLPQVATLTSDSVNDGESVNFSYGAGSTRLQTFAGNDGADISRDIYGSNRTTPDTAEVVGAQAYDAFGTGVPNGTEPLLEFGYRGQLTALGLPLMDARAYDPSTGRFTAPDPLAPVAGDPASTTPYPYVNNDPINLIDPLGLRSISDSSFGYLGNIGPGVLGGTHAAVSQQFDPVNCRTDVKVGTSNAQKAINDACGRALAAESIKSAAKWQQDWYAFAQGADAVLQPAVPLILALQAGGGAGSGARGVSAARGTAAGGVNASIREGMLAGSVSVKPATPTPGRSTVRTESSAQLTGPGSASASSVRARLSELPPGRTPKTASQVASESQLRAEFNRLTEGGRTIDAGTYPGEVRLLPDGTRVSIRSTSASGGPTIDIRFPDGDKWKIHIQ